jgi:membrane protein implicated in regulation of membrane protease activity
MNELLLSSGVIITMVVIWAVVIAAALYIEFSTGDLTSVWFVVGGIAALVCVPLGVDIIWQLLVFFVVSLAFLLSLRPLTRRFVNKKTIPTNLDINIGKSFKLLKDVKDGRSEIQIHDVIWTVSFTDEAYNVLKTGASVVVVGMDGNKYIVKGEE